MVTQKYMTTTTSSWPMWTMTTVTRRTPTCATCRTEHTCTLFSVSRLDYTRHTHIGSSRPWVRHSHLHTIHDERFSLSASTSPFTSTRTSSSFSFPSSPCTPTPTPTTLTPWLITCATPPRGASSPTTTSSRLQLKERVFWVAPRPKDKSGVVYDELVETDMKKSTHPGSRKSTNCWNWTLSVSCLQRKVTTSPRQHLRTSCQQTCWTSGSSRMTVQWPPRAGACWSVGKVPWFTSWSVRHPHRRRKVSWCHFSGWLQRRWLAALQIWPTHSDRLARRQEKTNLPQNCQREWLIQRWDHDSCCVLKQRFMDWCRNQAGCGQAWLWICWLQATSKNLYDKCLFTLFSSDETSEGQLLRDVDDFIEGGKETHRKTMEGFYDKYRCGRAVDFMSAGQEGTRFAWRRAVQKPWFPQHCVDGRMCQVKAPSHWSSKRIPVKHQGKKWRDAHEHQGRKWWFGLAGINSKTRHGWASLDHSIWVWPTIAATDFRGQRGSETMSCSPHHHHDLAHFICGATLDDIHRLSFRQGGATATPTRLVSVCHQQVLQPRTIDASEYASLAAS